MVELQELLDATYLGNSLSRWNIAIVLGIAAFVIMLLVRSWTRTQYARLAATPDEELLELPLQVASRTTIGFILITAIFIGMQAVALQARAERFLLNVFLIASFWQAGIWASTAVMGSLQRKQRRTLAVDRAAAGTLGIIGFIARVTIWSFVLLLTLDNVGIEIKPLLAGLGIGGIAVALAAQNILGDLFASLSIALDRPFVLGDFLQVDDFMGTVEYIGVKSTRLKSLSGEQIIMPNSNLLASRVRNHTRATDRRVVYTVGVDPQTPREQLQQIPGVIRSLIQSHPETRFDRSHFARIGTSSLDFEAVYFVNKTDFNLHMDILQDINLRLIEYFEREGIAFASPKQRLYVESGGEVKSELVSREQARREEAKAG